MRFCISKSCGDALSRFFGAGLADAPKEFISSAQMAAFTIGNGCLILKASLSVVFSENCFIANVTTRQPAILFQKVRKNNQDREESNLTDGFDTGSLGKGTVPRAAVGIRSVGFGCDVLIVLNPVCASPSPGPTGLRSKGWNQSR